MNSDRIEATAADWFARRQSGSWTDARQAEFEAWLRQHTAHRIAYIRLEAAWAHSDRMKALGAGVPRGSIPARGSWQDRLSLGSRSPESRAGNPSTAVRPWRVRWLGLAAGALLVLAGGGYLHNTGLFSGSRYSTRTGGIDTVPLADGSHITLNTNSLIHVDLAATERRIELDRGEAFFDVAKDARRPFIVTIGNKRVVAVGTKFSVLRDRDDIRVAVTEGQVRVESISGANPPREAGTASVLVSAGGVAQTAKAEVLVREQAATQIEDLLSWRKGYLVFRDMTLADAVFEFNRYNTRKIVIEDSSIAGIRIGGNFRSTSTEAFLWLIQSGFPVAVEQGRDQVVLRHR